MLTKVLCSEKVAASAWKNSHLLLWSPDSDVAAAGAVASSHNNFMNDIFMLSAHKRE